MNATAVDATVTIKTEAPEAGPQALKGALLCLGLIVAVVIGDVLWVGYPAAFAINAADFNPLPLFVVACAAMVGTITLISGVLHTLRFRKFGSSEFTTRESRLGQTVTGVVRPARELAPLGDFKARLRCDLRSSVRTAKGGRRTQTAYLWESIKTVPATARTNAGIPIEIAIPGNGLATGARKGSADADERVTWALEVFAPLRGVNYYAEFAIPVKGRQRDDAVSAGAESPKRTATGTASGPFAGCDAPRSQRWKWLLRGLVMFGLMITVAGTFGIADEVRSARVTGHVTAYNASTLDIAIDGVGPTPITAHVTHFPHGRKWEPGMSAKLVCSELKEGTHSCDIDTGSRWWIQTGIGMSVGLGMLLLAWVLWRRRRWWA